MTRQKPVPGSHAPPDRPRRERPAYPPGYSPGTPEPSAVHAAGQTAGPAAAADDDALVDFEAVAERSSIERDSPGQGSPIVLPALPARHEAEPNAIADVAKNPRRPEHERRRTKYEATAHGPVEPLPDPSQAKVVVHEPKTSETYVVEEGPPLAPEVLQRPLLLGNNAHAHGRRGLSDQTDAEGELLCPHCGYDLFRLQSARCPECGEAIEWAEADQDRVQRKRYGRSDWSWVRWTMIGVAVCTPIMLITTLLPDDSVGGGISRILVFLCLLITGGCCYGAAGDLPRDNSEGTVTTVGLVASGIFFFTMIASSVLRAIVEVVVG